MRTNKTGRTFGDLQEAASDIKMLEEVVRRLPISQQRRQSLRPAFISESAFTVEDHGFAAVVTADYIDKSAGTFAITFELLGWAEPVSLTIDDTNIRAIREMLGIGHEIERPFTYNELLTPKGRNDLAVAMRALNDIFEARSSRVDDWKILAEYCRGIAGEALAQINGEADHGTPSDS